MHKCPGPRVALEVVREVPRPLVQQGEGREGVGEQAGGSSGGASSSSAANPPGPAGDAQVLGEQGRAGGLHKRLRCKTSVPSQPPIPKPGVVVLDMNRPGQRLNKVKKYIPKPKVATVKNCNFTSSSGGACKFCGEIQSSANHVYTCKQAPWDVWVKGCKQRQNQKVGQAVAAAYKFECKYCGLRQENPRSIGLHISACSKRRVASGLPV